MTIYGISFSNQQTQLHPFHPVKRRDCKFSTLCYVVLCRQQCNKHISYEIALLDYPCILQLRTHFPNWKYNDKSFSFIFIPFSLTFFS